MSPEEIRKYCVAKITKTKIRHPMNENLYDPLMGPIESGVRCATCGEENISCPGHFGYINLEKKVVHPKFKQIILSILKCICFNCSASLIPFEHLKLKGYLEYYGADRIKVLKDECKKIKSCPEPNCERSTVNWELKDNAFYCYYENKNNLMEVDVELLYNILRKISDETFFMLGFNHNLSDNDQFKNPSTFTSGEMKHRHQIRPEWFIFSVLPVLPSCVRPCISPQPDEKQDDDLTDKYVSICKANEKLRNDREFRMGILKESGKRKSISLSEVDRKKVEKNLVDAITYMFDNSDETSKLTNGRAHKCFKSRLTGKEGHVRKNVQAKRCDFSARTVIDAGPTLKFHQVSIPQYMAKKITIPERVNVHNISSWNDELEKGNINFIVRKDRGKIRNLKVNKHRKLTLRVGDIVERHLRNGDYVIMNRQPTLRVESMNGHEVVIAKDPNEKVCRINLSACNGYNADFDGDEMNVHIPQNKMAMAEVQTLMNIENKIISSQHNQPVAGIVQDGLVGLYFLTRSTTRVDLQLFNDCLFVIKRHNSCHDLFKRARKKYPNEFVVVRNKSNGKLRVKPKHPTLPGRVLASALFPRDFYFTKKTYDDDEVVEGQDNNVVIENGILISGDLIKKVLGAKLNSIIHILAVEYSTSVAGEFISNAQFLCNKWFSTYSFSFGISDCLNSNKAEIQNTLSKMHTKCNDILSSNKTDIDKEIAINDELNSAISVGQSLTKEGMCGGIDNAMVVCTFTGAKGNYVNCSQIAAYLGQQNVMGGKRIPKQLSNGTRCLPHFKPNDESPAARGFIDRSFIEGISPTQFFFHSQSGREGLMDTAVNTRDSGYIQRCFIKKMENYKIHTDGSVRDCDKSIISFSYGDCGFNPCRLYNVKGRPFFIDIERISRRLNCEYEYTVIPKKRVPKITLEDRHIDVIFMQILPIGHMINSDVIENNKMIVQTHLRRAIKKVELYSDAIVIKKFMDLILKKFSTSQVEPGDMVGIIAACSLGESATQATLNSFHHSGISSKAVTVGVPRLKELMNTTKNPKTPSTLIYIKSEYISEREDAIYDLVLENSKSETAIEHKSKNLEDIYKMKKEILEELQSLRSTFEYTVVEQVLCGKVGMKYILTENGEIPSNTPIATLYSYEEYKKEWWCELSEEMHGIDLSHARQWVCEVTIDVEKLYYYNLTLKDIARSIEENDGYGNVKCVYSPLNIGKIIVFVDYDKITENVVDCLKKESNIIHNYDDIVTEITEMIDNECTEISEILELKCNANRKVEKIKEWLNENIEEIEENELLDKVYSTLKDVRNQMIDDDNWYYFYTRDIVIPNILNAHICGIEGINKIYPIEIEDRECSNKIKKKKWVLDVQGQNFKEIINLTTLVDFVNTISDDMWEIYNTLGILATRTFLVEEFRKNMCADGSYINPSHFMLLVDGITHSGSIKSVRRGGISRSVGAITKASFEEALNNLTEASIYTEVDDMNSVSATTAFGAKAKIGTSSEYFSVM